MNNETECLLSELVFGARSILTDNFVGGYAHGSLATGDFDQYSDVDFLILTRAELTEDQVNDLQTLHARIRGVGPRFSDKLEGSYFPITRIVDYANTANKLWYLQNGHGKLTPDSHDDTLVVRWVLRERGIAVDGPNPKTLMPPIPEDGLKLEVMSTLRAIPAFIIEEPKDALHFWNRMFGQSFAVLTCCRILHTVATGEVNSKKKAVEWAETGVDPKWSGLIQRAWANRCGDFDRPADPVEYASTLAFYEWAGRDSMKAVNSD